MSSARVTVLIVVMESLTLLWACTGSTTAPPVVETRQVTDGIGRVVSVPVKITRVVSLAPSLTENIFAVGAGDRLVGVTTFCNYPEQAKAIAKIGDTMNPNIETIVALKPDIVFVSTASQIAAFMTTLDANGITVYVSNPTSLETLYRGLVDLGTILNTDNETKSLVASLSQREKAVRDRRDAQPSDDRNVDRVGVFVQISREPLFTIGKGALLNDIIRAAGGSSVTADVESSYPKLSKETALALDPDVIILSESEDNLEPNEVFKNSPAVKRGNVFKINADLLSRPGPRLIDVMEQIARDLHAERIRP